MDSLAKLLKARKTESKNEKTIITHTRIPSESLAIRGGSYKIIDLAEFNELYFREVVQADKPEYLTERQLINGVIYVDLDFRYETTVVKRQHTPDFVEDLICIYLDTIKALVETADLKMSIFVQQRDDVCRLPDITKDGLHILIGMEMPHKLQLELRKRVMANTDTVNLFATLPLTNSLDKVFDEGLSKGTTPVQLFGSRKPSFDPYRLSKIYDCSIDPVDDAWMMPNRLFSKITKEIFEELSVRTPNRPKPALSKEGFKLTYPQEAKQRANVEQKNQIKKDSLGNPDDIVKLFSCFTVARIDTYDSFCQIGWALINSVSKIQALQLITELNGFCPARNNKSDKEKAMDWVDQQTPQPDGGLTIASLHYWAKADDPQRYLSLFPKQASIINGDEADALFDALLDMPNDDNYAKYFISLYGDKFRCVDIKNRVFYAFTKECLWVKDEAGAKVRGLIKNEMKLKFLERIEELGDGDRCATVKKCMNNLGTTKDIANMITEIANSIVEVDFPNDMNKAKDVLPLKGGQILDMNSLEIRDRTIADKFDYECDSTYRPLSTIEEEEIGQYFKDLFLDDATTQVVLNIIKSAMTGRTLRYVYFLNGCGRNGKSLFFNILKAIFKKGMDTMNEAVLVQPKNPNNINSEVEKLDKCRIAYVSELKETDKMNQKLIKKITGGDPINYRGLYKGDITLVPTANLFVITNELPEFDVEQATLDRIVVIPFLNRFEVDRTIETKMMAQLEQIFCYIMKKGIIQDSFELTEKMLVAKKEYVDDNTRDPLTDFVSSSITKMEGRRISRDEFNRKFTEYCLSQRIPRIEINRLAKKMSAIGISNSRSNSVVFFDNIDWKYNMPPPPQVDGETDEEEVEFLEEY